MGFISSYFRSMRNLPKEDKKIGEEGPCTSYSHQEEDRERSKKKTPSSGGEGDNLTNILPKSVQIIHEDIKKIRKEMHGESPQEFESKANSRLSYEKCEQAATHSNTQRNHMPRIARREMERGEEVYGRKNISDFLNEYVSQTQKF